MLEQYLADLDNFDSISQISETTQASELVAQRLANFNSQSTNEQEFVSADKVQVVNIHVAAVNIYGDNEASDGNDENDSIPLTSLNGLITKAARQNFEAKRQSSNSKWQKSENIVESKRSRNVKVFFAGCIVLLIAIIVALLTFKLSQTQKADSNPTNKKDLFVSKRFWNADLGRTGSKPLRLPVKRVIIMQSNGTESCDKTSCGSLMRKEQFSSFYLEHEDVRENFIVTSDGTVFEGRGFLREGQMTYDEFGTSYNKDAIGIKLISEGGITDVQIKSLKSFLAESVERKLLINNFFLFNYEQLTQATKKDEAFLKMMKTMETIQDSPEMTTSLSKAPSIEEKYCVEEVDKSIVAVKFLNSSRCVIQNECLETAKKVDGFERFHLVIDRNFAYQMKSIDYDDIKQGLDTNSLRNPEVTDNQRRRLFVMIIGDGFETKLEEILSHFVKVGKLEKDYQFCFECCNDLYKSISAWTKFNNYSIQNC